MLKIDADEVIEYTVKLEKLHRSALPLAIKYTLNNAAFDTKREIPKQGAKKFVTRKKGFLRAFSIVDKAQGWDMDKMVATVGINSKKSERIAKGLEAQEFGGNLYTGKLVPHDEARITQTHDRRLRRKNWLQKINAHDATPAMRAHKGTRSSKFVAGVMSTAKRGKKHMIIKDGGKGMLYEIKRLRTNKNGKTNFTLDKLFAIKPNSHATVDGRGFIRASKRKIVKTIPDLYKKNAEYRIKKYWK